VGSLPPTGYSPWKDCVLPPKGHVLNKAPFPVRFWNDPERVSDERSNKGFKFDLRERASEMPSSELRGDHVFNYIGVLRSGAVIRGDTGRIND
jgi:hypothetical protein